MVIFRESLVAEEYILILNVVKHVHKYINLQCQVKKKSTAKMYKIQNYYRCFTFLYKCILEFKQTSINVVFFQKQLHTLASCWYLTYSVPQSTKSVAVLMAVHIMLLSQYRYLILQHTFVRHSHRHKPTDLLTWHLYSIYHFVPHLYKWSCTNLTRHSQTSIICGW